MSYTDFKAWRTEVSYLLNNYISEKETFNLKVEQIPYGEELDLTSLGKIPVIKVLSYYKAVEIIGELKSYFSDRNIKILLRGQKSDYGYLQLPNLLRTENKNRLLISIIEPNFNFINENSPWRILYNHKEKILSTITGTLFQAKIEEVDYLIEQIQEEDRIQSLNQQSGYYSQIQNMIAWESILQHYEHSTKWIDLVENIPVALWFASKYNNSIRIEKNTIEDGRYGYIFIYGIVTEKQIAKGIWDGPTQRLINLAEATSPHALRPHMQSAYSLLNKSISNKNFKDIGNSQEREIDLWNLATLNNADYAKFLLCVFKLEQKQILEWLCAQTEQYYEFPKHLRHEILFPPDTEDKFYRRLRILQFVQ